MWALAQRRLGLFFFAWQHFNIHQWSAVQLYSLIVRSVPMWAFVVISTTGPCLVLLQGCPMAGRSWLFNGVVVLPLEDISTITLLLFYNSWTKKKKKNSLDAIVILSQLTDLLFPIPSFPLSLLFVYTASMIKMQFHHLIDSICTFITLNIGF